jgi:hypothetical protein
LRLVVQRLCQIRLVRSVEEASRAGFGADQAQITAQIRRRSGADQAQPMPMPMLQKFGERGQGKKTAEGWAGSEEPGL